ncbi:hypothetical protein [Deinococcus alpinitundrae]|uniref:hypothetical protein n=1 Tax=Deinococcus alpinitundrae TaxID=468913 RepID=UPI00137B4439|nr:hypothetical protein [Deinococcus alpinitundrae]
MTTPEPDRIPLLLSPERLYEKTRVFMELTRSEDSLGRRIGQVGQRAAEKLRPRHRASPGVWRGWFDRAWELHLLSLEISKDDYEQQLSLYEKVRDLEGELPGGKLSP